MGSSCSSAQAVNGGRGDSKPMGNRQSQTSDDKESKKPRKDKGRPSATSSSSVAVHVEDKLIPSPSSSPSEANTAGQTSTQSSPPPPHSTPPTSTVTSSKTASPAPVPAPGPTKSGPSEPPLPKLEGFRADVTQLLFGDVTSVNCSLKSNTIRIFVSACQADSELERSVLMERVFPKLQRHCSEHGYELQFVDLHWGQRSEDLDDHSLIECCLYELKECKKKSVGPNFMSFLNQKYNCQCPPHIPASAFEKLQNSLTEGDDKQLLDEWYRRDDNAIPPVYVLQPVSGQIKKYKDTNKDVRLKAEREWSDVQEAIKKILVNGWGKEEQDRYMCSVMEMEIENGPLASESSNDGTVWIRRVFRDIESHTNDSSIRFYIDTVGENEIDKNMQERLNQLKNRLGSKISEGNLKFEVSWSENGVDPEGISEHAQYIENLCSQSEAMLQPLIDKAICDVQTQQDESPVIRIHERLYNELQQHTRYCQELCQTFQGRQELLGKIDAYLGSNSQHPLIIHGPMGCGKTALMAKAAARCCQTLAGSVCVVRFVGATSETYALGQLLRSICEQIAYLYGDHISVGSKGIERMKKQLLNLLKKAQQKRPLVVMIDGIDELKLTDHTELEWIPKSLPAHVKMILSTSSDTFPGFSSLKSVLKDPAAFLEVPKLSTKEIHAMCEDMLKSHGRSLSTGQQKALQEATNQCPLPLFVQLATHTALRWRSYNISNETVLDKNIKEQIASLLVNLEKKFGAKTVKNVLSYLTLAKHGLSDAEMLDLLSCDDALLDEYFVHRRPSIRRAPATVWTQIKMELAPFFIEHIVHGRSLRTWSHRAFRDAVSEKYLSSKNSRAKVHKFLASYFHGHWAGDKKKPCMSNEEGIEVLMDRHVQLQPVKFNSIYNSRKLNELPYHVFHSGEQQTFLADHVWNVSWLCHKLEGSDIGELLNDVALARTADPQNADLDMLQQVLQLSSYALYCDGNQLFLQFHARLKNALQEADANKYPKLTQISKLIENPPRPNFLPAGDCLLEKVNQVYEDGDEEEEVIPPGKRNPKAFLNGLYRIKGDNCHMVSVSTIEGEVKVWNFETQKEVRTLKGIDQPMDIRMIDDYRAVVLCYRELKIYNLDTGTFETTLKGIMNLQMPYYGIQDNEHVVALARNRMYVNIINVSSGEVESTFKVGEDRFLNSLLVSENGERCVCGDATQKPSPLLVWDLNARKLINDFRITQHEFLTNMSAISKDGNYVVSVIKELNDPAPNFVIVYDLQSGQLFKKWKPVSSTCCVAVSSEGECVVNGCEDNTILVWNLTSGALKHTLRGHTHPVDRIYMSEEGHRCLTFDTTQKDRTVRLWDLQQGVCLASFTPDVPITCCQINADGTIVVIGLEGHKNIVTLRLRTSDSGPISVNDSIYGDPSRYGEVFDMKK
ncbi:NACHT domain- and WD repeat-containing protein 1-like isoform X2 [Ptychodera flava]|uniref:NACHT domain- and WD repeat-containing protein 1-like isoform X2 n=1 Tax=Ptychodera flava TaxID=63121 RepID=UPI00396A7C75